MWQDAIWCNQFSTNLIAKMTADVSPDQWRQQPAGFQNHAAWQLGHVTYSRANAAILLGKPGPIFPADLKVRFGTGSSPEPQSMGGGDRQVMLDQFWAAQSHIATILPKVTDATLDSPAPESMRAHFPLVRDIVRLILTSHDSLHAGQLSAWRYAVGLPRILG